MQQVTFGGEQVDMNKRDYPAFSFAIADPLDPGKIKGTRSTQFRIPATAKSRNVLGSRVMSEQTPSNEGIIRIGNGGHSYVESLIRPVSWGDDTIACVAVGNNASWIGQMQNLKIRALNMGDSEPVTAAYQESTWLDVDHPLYFPLIDYQYAEGTSFEVAKILPAIRCHKIIEAGLETIGYRPVVKGVLTQQWKKFILPAVSEPVVSAGFAEGESASVEQKNSGSFTIPTTGWYQNLPLSVDGEVDPGNNMDLAGDYTTPFAGTYSAFVGLNIGTATGPVNGSNNFLWLYNTANDVRVSDLYPIYIAEGIVIAPIKIAEVTLPQGMTIGLRYGNANGPTAEGFLEIKAMTFKVQLKELPYQEDVPVDIAKSGPNLSVFDVIKSLALIRNIAIDTNDITKEVVFQLYDDYYKSPVQGESLVGREDFTDPPLKKRPLKPRRVLFKWKPDTKDIGLEAKDEADDNLIAGFGGGVYEIPEGVLEEKKIELPFSASVMRTMDDLTIPSFREAEADTTGNFKWNPRILYADGLFRGQWTHDGEAKSYYPNAYFVFPGKNETGLAFSEQSDYGYAGPGNIATYWLRFFDRLSRSFTLEIDLMLYDDELIEMDFGKPRAISDGYEVGWYYFTSVNQKRFFSGETTRCDLIQV